MVCFGVNNKFNFAASMEVAGVLRAKAQARVAVVWPKDFMGRSKFSTLEFDHLGIPDIGPNEIFGENIGLD